MLKLAKFLVPVCAVLVAIAVSHADKSTTEVTKPQAAGVECQQCDVACSSCVDGAVAKAMEALPQLVYRIGDETTTSPVQAGRLSRKLDRKVEFVVGKKVFKDEVEAFGNLVETTEQFVAAFAKPSKCDVSGKTTVAGKSLCCDVAASEVAQLVKKAMDNVKVTYLVGKQSVCCPDAAKALAEKSGEKVVQLVAGQKCGGCSTTTRLKIAHAKYKAAIEALVASETKAADSADATVDVTDAKPNTEVSAS